MIKAPAHNLAVDLNWRRVSLERQVYGRQFDTDYYPDNTVAHRYIWNTVSYNPLILFSDDNMRFMAMLLCELWPWVDQYAYQLYTYYKCTTVPLEKINGRQKYDARAPSEGYFHYTRHGSAKTLSAKRRVNSGVDSLFLMYKSVVGQPAIQIKKPRYLFASVEHDNISSLTPSWFSYMVISAVIRDYCALNPAAWGTFEELTQFKQTDWVLYQAAWRLKTINLAKTPTATTNDRLDWNEWQAKMVKLAGAGNSFEYPEELPPYETNERFEGFQVTVPPRLSQLVVNNLSENYLKPNYCPFQFERWKFASVKTGLGIYRLEFGTRGKKEAALEKLKTFIRKYDKDGAPEIWIFIRMMEVFDDPYTPFTMDTVADLFRGPNKRFSLLSSKGTDIESLQVLHIMIREVFTVLYESIHVLRRVL